MATLFSCDSGTLPALHGGGAMTLDAGDGFPTAPAIKIEQNASAAAAALFSFAATSDVAVRAYFKMPAPGSASQVLIATNVGAGNPSARFAIGGTGQPGQARLAKDGATLAQSSAGLMTTGTWYRVELQHDGDPGRARAAVFPVASTTPIWDSGWMTDAAFASSALDRVRVGSFNANPRLTAYLIDSITGSDDISQWIGPHAGDTPASAFTVSIWDGASEIPAEASIWDGVTETPAIIEA